MGPKGVRVAIWAVAICVFLLAGFCLLLFLQFGSRFMLSEPPLSARAPARSQNSLRPLPNSVQGTVLFAESDLIGIDLPTLTEFTAWKRLGQPNLHAVSGPDKQGRIAMVANDMMANRHWLLIREPKSGKETKLFDRPGDALWGDIPRHMRYVSDSIALSPDTGLVALGVEMADFQIHNPEALLTEGPLEIWDSATKKARRLPIRIADVGFDWFPDGRHLAVVELVSPGSAPPIPTPQDNFMASFKTANAVPVISVVDTVTGSKIPLHQGWHPLVSDDGKTILAMDEEFNLRVVDVATKSSRTVHLPDFYGVAIAVLGSDSAIYLAKQQPGSEKLSQDNSPLVGPKDLPRIVYARFDSAATQTIVSYVDPRWCVSFGPGRKSK